VYACGNRDKTSPFLFLKQNSEGSMVAFSNPPASGNGLARIVGSLAKSQTIARDVNSLP